MDKNYVLENEYDVNRVMLKIFKIMIGVLPLTWLFKLINLFIVPWSVIIAVSITVLLLSGLPILVFKDYKNTNIKIYSVVFFLIISTLIYSTVFVNGIFFMMIPSLIALIYFDIKLLKIAFFSTLPLMIFGEVLASLTGQEFVASIKWIPLHIAVFSIQFFLIFILLLSLAKRAKNMLADIKDMFDNTSYLYNKIQISSSEVSKEIGVLYNNLNETKEFGNSIEKFISLTSEKTQYFSEDIGHLVDNSKEISKDIELTYDITSNMLIEINKTNEELEGNITNLQKLLEKFQSISFASEKSKKSVDCLFGEIGEIYGAVELIEKIQKQTNLLSINASIEASRIGEAGVGFKVVAEGIKNLALESSNYIEIIKKQIGQVEGNAKTTVDVIGETRHFVEEGMAGIGTLEDFFNFVKEKLFTTNSRIKELNQKMNQLETKEKTVNKEIFHIEESNKEIIENISSVNARIEEFGKTLESNIHLLKSIDEKSKINI